MFEEQTPHATAPLPAKEKPYVRGYRPPKRVRLADGGYMDLPGDDLPVQKPEKKGPKPSTVKAVDFNDPAVKHRNIPVERRKDASPGGGFYVSPGTGGRLLGSIFSHFGGDDAFIREGTQP